MGLLKRQMVFPLLLESEQSHCSVLSLQVQEWFSLCYSNYKVHTPAQGRAKGTLTGKWSSVGSGMEWRRPGKLSRCRIFPCSWQQFPTRGFSKAAKGSATALIGEWEGTLSWLLVLQGEAQVPHHTKIFFHSHSNLGHVSSRPPKIILGN